MMMGSFFRFGVHKDLPLALSEQPVRLHDFPSFTCARVGKQCQQLRFVLAQQIREIGRDQSSRSDVQIGPIRVDPHSYRL
jgi:hypothetical protein